MTTQAEATAKIAEVLFDLNPDKQPWNGDPYSYAEATRRGEYHAGLAAKQAATLIELGYVNPSKLHFGGSTPAPVPQPAITAQVTVEYTYSEQVNHLYLNRVSILQVDMEEHGASEAIQQLEETALALAGALGVEATLL